MANRFIPINPGSDLNQVISIMNKNFAELDSEANAKVFYGASNQVAVNQGQLPNNLGTGLLLRDNTGTPSIAMYVDSSGKPVLKVANTGQNAVTATGQNLIFNSAQNTLKVVNSGNVSLTTTASSRTTVGVGLNSGEVSFAHNLGYTPIILAFSTGPSYISPLPVIDIILTISSGNYFGESQISTYADINNIYFSWRQILTVFSTASGTPSVGGYTYGIKYYLLQETAS